VIGQFGLGLLIALGAGALVMLALGTGRERLVAAALLVIPWIAGFALRGIEWTQPYSRPISVAIVQGAIPQDEKWIGENLEEILDRYQVMTREAHGADLIVWPESAAPALANDLVAYYQEVYREASREGSALLMGTLREERGAYFNSVLAMDPKADGVGWYDKHHLVPFTEFVPVPGFVRTWLKLRGLPYSDFTRGDSRQVPLEAAGQFIAANVCYEDAYGATQLPALRTATLLVNVTNDAWFGQSTARYQHLQISRLRAREAGRPMIRAANTGVSAVIDAHGAVVAAAPEFVPDVLQTRVQPRSGLTPYAHTGNWPVVCLSLVLMLVGALVRRRGMKVRSAP
jgi:apolipoprotein N-acyltransferase